jgi:tRNA(adenine34) deaminase
MNDEFFMRKALKQAEKSLNRGEVPVGAVIVSGEKIVSEAHNSSLSSQDPTAHAEIVAIREACQKRRNYRLLDCDLYVTLEPCPMCLGAVIQARIRRLVFGALDPKGGAVESVMKFPVESTNHRVEIKGGVMSEECGKILREFFQRKR